jgi:DNA-binding transcriptional MocR family regulator
MEYNRTTGNCFISDKVLAEMFGVSDKTISRTMKALEDRGFIVRATKSVKGGKERHITVNLDNIEKALSTDKMTVDSGIQQTNCPLTTDNLSNDNRQNDLIKDNIKDNSKRKDNSEMFQPTAENISL